MMTMVMPSCASSADDADHLLGLVVAEAGQRLVEQQDARLPGERARQLHQAQLARRQLAGQAMGVVGQADPRDRIAAASRRASASVSACT